LELKQRLQRTAHYSRDDKAKLARIIDSEDEDFENGDKWVQVKNELANQVHKLMSMLNGNGESVSKEVLGFGVPTRHRTYILGCSRQWMSEDEYKSKRPKFGN
jgi:hypothetical protein